MKAYIMKANTKSQTFYLFIWQDKLISIRHVLSLKLPSEAPRRITSSPVQNHSPASPTFRLLNFREHVVSDSLMHSGFPLTCICKVWSFALASLLHVYLIIWLAKRTLKAEISSFLSHNYIWKVSLVLQVTFYLIFRTWNVS